MKEQVTMGYRQRGEGRGTHSFVLYIRLIRSSALCVDAAIVQNEYEESGVVRDNC